MEISSSRSQAALSQKSKQEDSLTRSRTSSNTDRFALLDITNDSPIVGVSAGGLAEKMPLSSAVKSMIQMKPTPGSGESLLRGQVKILLQKVEEESELVNNPAEEVVMTLKKEELGPCLINRALLFDDSPDKSETSDTPSTILYQGSGGGSSLNWSLEANASVQDVDDKEGLEDYDGLCDFLNKLSVEGKARLPEFEGKHTRFIYNSDDEIQGEVEVGEMDKAVSPGATVLKGLPVPEGKHIRFQEEED